MRSTKSVATPAVRPVDVVADNLAGDRPTPPVVEGPAVDERDSRHVHLDRRLAVMGIAPGLDGAVALILPGGAGEAHITPTLAAGKGDNRRFDASGMVALLESHPVDPAVIEVVGPMPRQGVASTSNLGAGYGLWLGMLVALCIPFQPIMPQAWKKAILAGTAKDKATAVEYVHRRHPGVPLLATPRSRVPHDGLADAVCLAEYARRLRGD